MDQPPKFKILLLGVATVLFAIIAAGLGWFFVVGGASSPAGAGWYLFSFAAGLTMIVLPCTLPLAFVIVPLSLGKGPIKGLGIAVMFGIGIALMLSVYGIVAAALGNAVLGTTGISREIVKNWFYFVAGVLAYVFALAEIGLAKYHMPTYKGAAPAFIQKQGDYGKALLLGLFLGNIGVGCPHPATPFILGEIATSGNIFYGWTLFLTHALGRVVPLLLLTILALLGVNGLSWLVTRKDKIERATGWGMVFVAGFILVLGLFSHDWWVYSGQHTLFEEITQEHKILGLVADQLNSTVSHAHGTAETIGKTGLFGLPLALGNWVLVFLWTFPIWWYYIRKRRALREAAAPKA